jgi:LemA protein
MTFGYAVLGLVVIIAGYLVYVYNAFISNKNYVAEGWSGIDVQLRRRADLIPNLIETVKGYASHEDKLFRDITDRASDDGGFGAVVCHRRGLSRTESRR